nr:MAG TPA: hypothetical protein [Caudoviricetes sp.]
MYFNENVTILTYIRIISYNTHMEINPFRSTLKWQIWSEDGGFFYR